jgi:hypothetical protein
MILKPLIVCVVLSIGPGFFIVGQLRWRPLETLAASVGLSWIIVYLAAFVIYAGALPDSLYLVLFCLAAIAALACGRGLWRLFRVPAVYRSVAAWLCVLGWGLAGLALIRNYSGGNWSSDWFEHFERTQFFAHRWPLERGLSGYLLPARPPFMNLAAASVLSITGLDFQSFQVVFVFLNSLVVIPLCLICPALAGGKRIGGMQGGGQRSGKGVSPPRTSLAVLTVLLMANPLFQQNVTWTWTKLFTAFYVILGCALYLAGKRRQDAGGNDSDPARTLAAEKRPLTPAPLPPMRTRGASETVAAFLALAAGCLVHYSAAPFALYVTGYEVVSLPGARRRMWRASLMGWLLGLALLATWFGWSWQHYQEKTFSSTTTVAAWSRGTISEEFTKFAGNAWRSFIPHPVWLSMSDFEARFGQSSSLGFWRDYFFLVYQTNFIFGIGAMSGVVAVALALYIFSKRSRPWRGQGLFWVGFLFVTIPLGILVHPAQDTYGVAHICGQPVVLLGVALVATWFTALPRWLRGLVVIGTAIDLALGVLTQWLAESVSSSVAARFSSFARYNQEIAVRHHVRFLGDAFSQWTAAIAVGLAVVGLIAVCRLAVQPRRGDRESPGVTT